ncbi:Acetyltransferase [Candidatus Desulfarcum epimagneticum]|uniref:Acetyltransferase n=1 Tax=uncultured Desulfobacteraceae bacterium TaxID=218296 RepID=A0A484HC20_9BACT|nr:Acetyltransferase [uncultured Desulfobacteraceae bacterium]
MIRDHRPYWMKKAHLTFQSFYVRRFLKPQFESLGPGFTFMKPWHVRLFGAPIEMGACANVIATPDQKVRLSVWPEKKGMGGIRIGDYCLICPGVRIGSAMEIVIGDNCMIAGNAYIADSDWHDIHNRISAGRPRPVDIGDNVWIGDGAIVCKGVSIGANSVIGAGSVVTHSVPPNAVAAGNPAKVVRKFDPNARFLKRDAWFSDPFGLETEIDRLDREMLKENTFFGWLSHILFPQKGD